MNLCVDFDDLCDGTADMLGPLQDLKDKFPEFRVTLFTIPQRTSDRTISAFRSHAWIQLAPHGWRHTRGECLSWTDEEAEAKITAACDRGIAAPVFRAPGWLIDGDVYKACHNRNYVVASHRTFRVPDTGAREYVYNIRSMDVHGVHGHLTPVSDNYILDMIADGRLDFTAGARFVYPWQVSQVIEGSLCEY